MAGSLGSRHPASFRDPGSYVFIRDGVVYRQINRVGSTDYDRLMASGLYAELVANRILVPHDEMDFAPDDSSTGARVIRPQHVPYISYPYEWTFEQLRAAADVTFAAQRAAQRHGMRLKDASAYNVQFIGTRPVFVDTGSFEIAPPDEAWVAYRQACEHFLAPLALMRYHDPRVARALLQANDDGIPLELAARLLPRRTLASLGLLMHVHVHAWGMKRWSASGERHTRARTASVTSLVEHLASTTLGIRRPRRTSAWTGYYGDNSYTPAAFAAKKRIVQAMLSRLKPERVLDLGANTGEFSDIAESCGAYVVAAEGDHDASAAHHDAARRRSSDRVLPLWVDIASPTPAVGVNNVERPGFLDRCAADVTLALALVHHLALARAMTLADVATLLAPTAPRCVVEFVPPDDPMVVALLAGRPHLRAGYDESLFSAALSRVFTITERAPIDESGRILYLLNRK